MKRGDSGTTRVVTPKENGHVSPVVQIGVDENGLGSRLGPMTVTGVRLRVRGSLARDLDALRTVCARAGIADSKAVAAHGAMAGTEARVLALLRVHLHQTPASLRAWTEAAGLDGESALRAPCPARETSDASSVCFGDPIELPAFGAGPTEADLDAATALLEAGVQLESVRVGVACAHVLNDARSSGVSRFDIDLRLMVRLLARLRDDSPAHRGQLEGYCGKVGARKSYAAALETLAPLCSTRAETRARSSYRVPGFGDVHFVLDGDATEPSIGLASLFGKYARELWMERHNRYWLAANAELTRVPGYHDPVTDRLVRATELVRAERSIAPTCFER